MKFRSIIVVAFVALALVSCNDWLDVTSKTEIPNDEHFSSESGFKDAVIGVYVKMAKPELYSKTLTWHVNEFVSQNYAVVAGAPDLNLPKYEYNLSPFVSYRNSIWLNCYQVLANINNILRYEVKNRQVMGPVLDSLVRGELLGIRALVHFDLLRMFGKGNLGSRPQLLDELAIPYSLDFNKYAPEQVTYRKYLSLLKNDAEEAIRYLEADPINGKKDMDYYTSYIDNSFLTETRADRKFRMNYYAVQALYARILMWEGTDEAKEKALAIAENLIEECFEVSAVSWAYESSVKGTEWWKSDLLFKAEHLFTLSVEKLFEVQELRGGGTKNWFDASSPNNTYSVVFLTKAKAQEIYETPGIGDSDWRFTDCLLPQGSNLSNYALVKLRQHPDHSEIYSRMIPMIRMTEMFYIAAECRMIPGKNYNREKALEYLNTVRDHRGIAQSDELQSTLKDNEILEEITKEYRKELVGEGQIFFYYKRKGVEVIPGYNGVMDDAKYQYPMPDDENILGGRTEK